MKMSRGDRGLNAVSTVQNEHGHVYPMMSSDSIDIYAPASTSQGLIMDIFPTAIDDASHSR